MSDAERPGKPGQADEPGKAGETSRPLDLGAYGAWLFDLDGLLTKTAAVHAAAWKQAFDEFLHKEATRSGKTFTPFDPKADYARYVDGEPLDVGVQNFLAARDIKLPDGTDDDPSRMPAPSKG